MTAGPESRGAGLSRRFDAVAPGVGARQTGSSEALTLQLAQSRLEITTLKEQIAALRVQQAAAAASAAALTSRRNEEAAAATVRALIPAVETYYADNSSYAGITTEKLRAYDNGIDPTRSWIAPTDAGVPAGVAIPDAGAESYCAVSLVGRWYSWKLGPGGAVRTSQQPQAACRP